MATIVSMLPKYHADVSQRRGQLQQQLADEDADGIRKKPPPQHGHRAASKICETPPPR